MVFNLLNAAGILIGGLFGLLLQRFLSEKLRTTLFYATALCVLYIGVRLFSVEASAVVVLLSLSLGVFVGESLRLEDRMAALAACGEAYMKKTERDPAFAHAFISSVILFCSGSMGILGALEAGLSGSGTILVAKAIVDGIAALIYAANLGAGVLFSAPFVALYQGFFTLCASPLQGFLNTEILNNLSAVGGIVLLAIGLEMYFKKGVRLSSFIPAVFLPILFGLVQFLFA